jgi:hypothetical protein
VRLQDALELTREPKQALRLINAQRREDTDPEHGDQRDQGGVGRELGQALLDAQERQDRREVEANPIGSQPCENDDASVDQSIDISERMLVALEHQSSSKSFPDIFLHVLTRFAPNSTASRVGTANGKVATW